MQHLGRIPPAKSVNRLIRIGNREQLPLRLSSRHDGGEQAKLIGREIVIFIDEDETQALVQGIGNRWVFPKQLPGQPDQILEIEQPLIDQLVTIRFRDGLHRVGTKRDALHRRDIRVRFSLANPLPDLCDLDVVHLVVAGGLQCEANDVRAAELVTDLKSVWNAKLGAMISQQIERPAMHRSSVHMRIRPLGDTVLKFVTGFVGIGQREDLIRLGMTVVQQPGNPLRDRVRFAAARRRDDQHMPVEALELNDATLTIR